MRDPDVKQNHNLMCPGDPAHGLDQVLAMEGIDVTLIRWMLSLTPAQRLQVLQDQVEAILKRRAKADN
jgi:hypothetical protein